jgi:hypothetical protein
MKSYKDFLVNKKQSIQEQVVEEIVSQEPEILELEDLPNLLGEEQNHHEPMDPPSVLIMRRKSIRQYPNGQRVALYFVDKVNKYVTVPYTAMQWSSTGGGVAEELTPRDRLQSIIEDVDSAVQQSIMKIYNRLNESNRQKFLQLAENDFEKLLDFVEKNK